jgi:predicted  nucleic acid-binding Zn-ribbon protein
VRTGRKRKNPLAVTLARLAPGKVERVKTYRDYEMENAALEMEKAALEVEAERLRQELAALKAADKESESLMRQIDAAENRVFEETFARFRAARAEIPSLDEITEVLRGSPSAQALAKMVINAARKARGEHDGKASV